MDSFPFLVSFLVSFLSFLDPFHGTAFRRTCVVCKLHGVGAQGELDGMGGVGGKHGLEDTLDVVASYQEEVQTCPGFRKGGDTSHQEEGVVERCGLVRTQGKEEEGEEGRVLQVGTCLVVQACEVGVAFCAAGTAA